MDAHTIKPAAELAKKARTPFPGESTEYRKAREALLAEEIEFRRHMTRLAEQRRALPPGPTHRQELPLQGRQRRRTRSQGPVRRPRYVGHLFLDVRPATRASLPDVHQLARCGERQCRGHQAACGAEDFGRSPVERQLAFAVERGWRHLDFVQTVGDDYAKDLGILTRRGGNIRRLSFTGARAIRSGCSGPANEEGHGRFRSGSARRTGHRVAVVDPRSNAWWARHRLVSKAELLSAATPCSSRARRIAADRR